MKRSYIGVACAMMLMGAGEAAAQTAGACGGPAIDTVVVNPMFISFRNEAHPIAVSYLIGVVDLANDPTSLGTVFVSQTPLPLATITPKVVAGEVDCYEAPIPLAVQATLLLLKQFRATLNYAVDLGSGAQLVGWSAVSNPFVKAGSLTPLSLVRVGKKS